MISHTIAQNIRELIKLLITTFPEDKHLELPYFEGDGDGNPYVLKLEWDGKNLYMCCYRLLAEYDADNPYSIFVYEELDEKKELLTLEDDVIADILPEITEISSKLLNFNHDNENN